MNNKNKAIKENTNKYLLPQENIPLTLKLFNKNIPDSKAKPEIKIKNQSTSVPGKEYSNKSLKNNTNYSNTSSNNNNTNK